MACKNYFHLFSSLKKRQNKPQLRLPAGLAVTREEHSIGQVSHILLFGVISTSFGSSLPHVSQPSCFGHISV